MFPCRDRGSGPPRPLAASLTRRCATIPPPWGLLALGALVLLPGDALYRLLFTPTAGAARPPGPGERLLLRALIGVVLVGWWALALAEAGAFAAPGVVLGVVAFSAVPYALAWRLGRLRGPLAAPRPRPTLTGLALAAILALAATLFFAKPFETIVGAEDAGVYFSSGGAIARTGGILIADAGLATFGDAAADARGAGPARHLLLPLGADRYRFVNWQRLQGFFLLQGERNTVTPQFLHLFPTWLALWAALGGGVGAMVYAGPAFALLGVATAHFLARRLFGPAVGLLAALLLTLNGLQLWFARQSLSETLLQALLLGAAYAWTLFVEARDGGDKATARGAAALAGLALGSVALTHAQFLFALLPLAPLAAWLWLARRWRGVYWWFALPLAVLLTHAAFHIWRYALGYFEGIYHHVWINAWRDRGQTALLILAPVALVAALDRTRRRWLPLLADPARLRAARLAAAGGIALAGLYGYLIWPGLLAPGTLAGYIGAPIPPGTAAGIVSLGWYFSPLGIALALAGLVLLVACDLEERAVALLALVAPFAGLFLLTGTYTAGGYIYGLRRFVPLIAPVATILIAYAALRGGPALAGALRRPRLAAPLRALGLAAAALLVAFFLATNARIVAHREYAGLLDQVAALDARFGPDDVVLFSGERDLSMKLATPLQYLFGRESWVVTTNLPNGPQLDDWIARREAAGRPVRVLMSANGGKLFLPDHRLEPAGTVALTLRQFETLDAQKPYNPQENALRYSIYTVHPAPPGAARGALGPPPYRLVAGEADERAQIAGFNDLEPAPGPIGPVPARWTNGDALLRVPWPGDGRPLTLRLTLSGGKYPAALGPAQVVVGLRPDAGSAERERPLATLTLTPDFAEYTVEIPPGALGPTPDGTAVIHLAAPRELVGGQSKPRPGAVWKPASYPGEYGNSPDDRDLHLRFRALELLPGP